MGASSSLSDRTVISNSGDSKVITDISNSGDSNVLSENSDVSDSRIICDSNDSTIISNSRVLKQCWHNLPRFRFYAGIIFPAGNMRVWSIKNAGI